MWLSGGTMRTARTLLTVTTAALCVATLSACDSSFSSKCDIDNTCTITIQGSDFHDFPRAYATKDGVNSADRIRLVSATEGGEALIQAGGIESTCTQGSSFVIVDTTITCDVVGDDVVELTSTRP